MKTYAVYKGDDLVVIGTAQECADAMNIKKQSIYWMNTKIAKERRKNYKKPNKAVTVEVIEDDEE